MTTIVYARHPGAVGEILLVGERGTDGRIVLAGCYLPGDRRGPAVDPAWQRDEAAFTEIAAAIDRHLAGDPAATAFLPVAPRGGTPFQRRVWDALRSIPAGGTVTYGQLARRVDRPSAARAVGSAVARNPIAIVVPCHRVVGADGSLGGYAGGLAAKRYLLAIEGAAFAAG
jgi:methylated-DNA-[protein]-cysteine S-methyltransferase